MTCPPGLRFQADAWASPPCGRIRKVRFPRLALESHTGVSGAAVQAWTSFWILDPKTLYLSCTIIKRCSYRWEKWGFEEAGPCSRSMGRGVGWEIWVSAGDVASCVVG